jgi:hypothetical protein
MRGWVFGSFSCKKFKNTQKDVSLFQVLSLEPADVDSQERVFVFFSLSLFAAQASYWLSYIVADAGILGFLLSFLMTVK